MFTNIRCLARRLIGGRFVCSATLSENARPPLTSKVGQQHPSQILLANPSTANDVGRGGRSPSGSKAHRRPLRLLCDPVGERPPGSAADQVRQQHPSQVSH